MAGFTKVKGYNIVFQANIGGSLRKFAGVTSDTFDIDAKVNTSLTKDNKGSSDKEVTGFDYDFSAEGVYEVPDESAPDDDSAAVSTPDIVDAMLSKAVLDFVYGGETPGSKVRKGKCIIVKYHETTTAEGESTWSLNLQVTGDIQSETLPTV